MLGPTYINNSFQELATLKKFRCTPTIRTPPAFARRRICNILAAQKSLVASCRQGLAENILVSIGRQGLVPRDPAPAFHLVPRDVLLLAHRTLCVVAFAVNPLLQHLLWNRLDI